MKALTGTVVAGLAAGVALAVLPAVPSGAADDRGNLDALAAARSPTAASLPGGSGGTSASGDFTYRYPIEVPPGRKGRQPSLALAYDSSAPVHGGVAAGWTLPYPVITVDPQASTVQNAGGGSASSPRNFIDPHGNPMVVDASLPASPGGVGYRALGDTSFTRFEYLARVSAEPYWWRAYRSDGVVLNYGLKSSHPYSYAPLIDVVDGDGHRVEYSYSVVGRNSDAVPAAGHPREILLRQIRYFAPSGTAAYARIMFGYADPVFCGTPSGMPAVGSRLDYRYGFGMLSGTRKLTSITTWARAAQSPNSPLALSREYTLGYSATDVCSTSPVAPFRQLSSVRQKVYSPSTGDALVLPPTEFTYGAAASYVQGSHYNSVAQDLPGVVLPSSIQTFQKGTLGGTVPGKGFQRCPHKFCPNPGPNGSSRKPAEYDAANLLSRGQADGESVQSMWLDVNGDGKVDLLRRAGQVELGRFAPGTGGCRVEVWVNKGGAGFQVDPDAFSFSLRDAFADIPVSAAPGSDGDGELLCTLSRSFSSTSSGWRGDASKPCASQDAWTAPESWGSMQQVIHSFADVDGDRRPDLLSVPIASIDCPYASTFGLAPPTAQGFQDQDWIDHFVVDGFRKVTRRQKWVYVYRNTGTRFETSPQRVRMDNFGDEFLPFLPQASLKGEFRGNVYAEDFLGTYGDDGPEIFVDLTGDGTLDRVTSTTPVSDEAGSLSQGFATLRYSGRLALPGNGKNSAIAPAFRDENEISQSPGHIWSQFIGLGVDVNGDGLPDHLEWKPDAVGTEVAYNTGFGFGTASTGNAALFSGNAPDTKYLASRYVYNSAYLGDTYWNGIARQFWGYPRRSMSDLDYDGLPDLLYRDGSSSRLYLNGGTAWAKSVSADAAVTEVLAGRISRVGLTSAADGSTNEFGDRSDYEWRREADAVDINADGLLDLVGDFDSDAGVEVRYARNIVNTAPDHAAPARLLRTIKNGYGAKTTVKYARSTAAGKWVAVEVTTSPGQGEPDIVTRYSVGASVYRINPYGLAVFRGFTTVVELRVGDPGDSADDLSIARVYSYDEDHRGRLVTVASVLGDGVFQARSLTNATGVMSIAGYDHHVKDYNLYAGGMTSRYPSNVVLPAKVTSYVCAGENGQAYASCLQSPAGSSTDEIVWESRTDEGRYVMELPVRRDLRFANADGRDELRRTVFTHRVAWSGAAFNTALGTTADYTFIDGSTSGYQGSRSFQYHDPEFRLLKSVTVDNHPHEAQVTRFAYHISGPAKGQVHKVWRPEQVHRYGTGPDAAGFTEFRYDPIGLYPVRITDPAGHTVTVVTDPRTGVPLRTSGPGYVCRDGADAGTVPDPPSACSFDAALHREGTTVDVDGLGRILSVSVRPQDGGAAEVMSEYSYNDSAAYDSGGATPVSVTVENRVTAGVFSKQIRDLDGLGRVVRGRTYQFPHNTRVVTYDYDPAGRLSLVHVPRGDAEPGTVDISTGYDPLGRVRSVSETGSGSAHLQEHGYSGLRHTVRQGEPGDGSLPAETVTTMDSLGQVISVAERSGTDAAGGPTYATTTYRYDGRGRVRSMVDPGGVLTEMSNDYIGNRRTVTTGGRVWEYDFDRNNNPVAFTEPVPAGAAEADYTHTQTFDDLDRITSQTPAVRDLADDERARLWIGPKTFHYDRAHPSVDPSTEAALYQTGRLSYTSASGITGVNTYDRFGYLTEKQQRMPDLPGTTGATLIASLNHNVAGALESLTYSAADDSGTLFTGRTATYSYNSDGVQGYVGFPIEPGKTMGITNERDDSGLVKERRTNVNYAAGYASPKVHYGRDGYGRLTSLRATVGTVQAYRQAIGYHDAGTIESVEEQLGGVAAPTTVMRYTYDHRHQLTTATQDGGARYHGVFSYGAAGRMRSADVSADSSASRVPVREVTHIYQDPQAPGGDGQRLAALREPGGTDLATYEYDELGNMTSRTLPDGTTVAQTWDGPRLRKVAKPGGATEVYYYDGAARVAAVRYYPGGTIVAESRRWFGDLEVEYHPGYPPKYRQYLNLAGETVGRLEQTGDTFTFEHYVTSPQGHHVLALDAASGATRRVASYGPFGEVLTETFAEDKYLKEFNGKTYHSTGALLHYGYRDYDPLALQWISADPLYRVAPDAAPQRRANLYSFTLNNAVSMVDPNGLDTTRTDSGGPVPESGGLPLGSGGGRPAPERKWAKVTGPDARFSPKGSVELDGRGEARFFDGEAVKVDIFNGFLVVKVAAGELGVSLQGGALLPFFKGSALSAELRAPIPVTDDFAVLVYGKGKALGATFSARPSVYVLDGAAGLGWRDEHGDSIFYVGGQFLGTRPIYAGVQVDGYKLDIDPGSQYLTPLGYWIGDVLFEVTYRQPILAYEWYKSWINSEPSASAWDSRPDAYHRPVMWR